MYYKLQNGDLINIIDCEHIDSAVGYRVKADTCSFDDAPSFEFGGCSYFDISYSTLNNAEVISPSQYIREAKSQFEDQLELIKPKASSGQPFILPSRYVQLRNLLIKEGVYTHEEIMEIQGGL